MMAPIAKMNILFEICDINRPMKSVNVPSPRDPQRENREFWLGVILRLCWPGITNSKGTKIELDSPKTREETTRPISALKK